MIDMCQNSIDNKHIGNNQMSISLLMNMKIRQIIFDEMSTIRGRH